MLQTDHHSVDSRQKRQIKKKLGINKFCFILNANIDKLLYYRLDILLITYILDVIIFNEIN